MIEGTHKQDEQLEGRKSRPWRKALIIMAVLVAVGAMVTPAISRWLDGAPQLTRASLNVAVVRRGELINDVAVSGRIVAASAPSLYSSEAGVVDLLARPGDAVSEGDVVARMNSPELTARIRQQQAQVAKLLIDTQRGDLADKETQLDLQREVDTAKVALHAAKREKKRAEISFKQQLISELDWVTAKDKLLEAELFYQHAARKVALAKERLSFESKNRQQAVDHQQLVLDELNRREQALAITAPVDGVVGNWLVGQKDRVAAAVALLTIVDLSRYEAELKVPEFYAEQLGLGLSVSLQIAGHKRMGEVVSVSPEIQNNQVLVRVRMPDTSELSLRQNQRLNARIEFDKKAQALMLRRGAFLQSGGKHHVFKMTGEDSAEKVPVTLGISSVDAVEVLDGLKAGDEVIVSSYQGYLDKDRIQLTE